MYVYVLYSNLNDSRFSMTGFSEPGQYLILHYFDIVNKYIMILIPVFQSILSSAIV